MLLPISVHRQSSEFVVLTARTEAGQQDSQQLVGVLQGTTRIVVQPPHTQQKHKQPWQV